MKIVPVAHVDHRTPYCIHGWFSSCHPFVFVFSLAFYEFFMLKLVLFILPVACSVLLLFIYVNVCLLGHVCDCFYMYEWCILCVIVFLFLIISVGLRALLSSCLPVYLHICLPTLNKDYLLTNSPIRASNIYESSPFSRKKFLALVVMWKLLNGMD